MEKIFRKIATKDRMPKREGKYCFITTNNESLIVLWNPFEKTSEYVPLKGGNKFKFWLEEIELPIEPIIDSVADDYGDKHGLRTESYDSSKALCYAFEAGAKWLRDFVLAVTPK